MDLISDFAMVGFTWLFLIGGVFLAACVVNDNNDFQNSKAYKDLNETMLNRNENV